MKGITYTQVAQYCVLIFAYLVPAIFISLTLTNNPIPMLGLGSTLAAEPVYLLDKLDGLTTELGMTAFTAGNKSTIDMFFIAAALMAGTAGLPHVIVRFFYRPSGKRRQNIGGLCAGCNCLAIHDRACGWQRLLGLTSLMLWMDCTIARRLSGLVSGKIAD